MKKNIIALAVAAAMIAPVAAMADTTLYGKFHVSYDFLSGDKAANTSSGFSSNSSIIGIKGKEKINDNLSMIYQYETEFDAGTKNNSGFNNSSGGLGTQRNTFIGATGTWGTVIAGRHDSPFKIMGRTYDLFGDTVGDSRNIISGSNSRAYTDANGKTVDASNDRNWDLRPSQVLAYATPDLMGFKAMLAYVSNWSANAPVAVSQYNTQFKAYSLSAGYSIAGFGLDAAYEQHKADILSGVPGATTSQSAYRLGANYSIAGVKVLGMYQDIKSLGFLSGADQKTYGVGAAYTFLGANTIKAQYYKAADVSGTTGTGANMWALGYDYALSKQTNVYAMYAQSSNGSNATYSIMSAGTGHGGAYPENTNLNNTGSFAGGKSSAISVGVQHKF